MSEMLPRIVVHALITLDGKIEGFRPEAIAPYYRLAGRLDCDTCLVGADTLLTAEDSPEMQIHPLDLNEEPLLPADEDGRVLMVVPDSRGRLRNWQTHMDGVGARGAIALISAVTPRSYVAYLERRRIPSIEAGADHVDYRLALAQLAEEFGVERIRTDSGGLLSNQLIAQGLVAELSLVVAPDLVGRTERGLFRTLTVPAALRLKPLACELIEDGFVWLRYEIDK